MRHGADAFPRPGARPRRVPPRASVGGLGRRLGQHCARARLRHPRRCRHRTARAEHAATAARYFSLGDARQLRSLFAAAGFHEVETFTEARRFPFASFEAYFAPIEGGLGPTGQAFAALPAEVRHVVCEEVRRQLEDGAGGPIEVEVELLFACGRR